MMKQKAERKQLITVFIIDALQFKIEEFTTTKGAICIFEIKQLPGTTSQLLTAITYDATLPCSQQGPC